ncbi:ACP S-malonyltransferase [Lachnospiraceae bacterium MD1]|jgi:[acyl-carrier-protein] S-malonyltransferase|uniref:Malonyl CoA-acyl carrier protein transacylase n=1 Tax=Variimorphobacter saccharofermentans TaxID=2755051 RepID=A0A839JZ59_9FIRM|nr:ACP S-malonyltransferase [Variimorphobacter saccharofermentans]MBB2182262.1 ACP S-malonyltransferase [Variimorphobacter saccharofermentans]
MIKTAFIFAGQGAQYIGMGKELYDFFPVCKKTFEEASNALHMDLTNLIFQGRKEDLDLTENTQPAVVTTSIAAYRAITEYGIIPDVVAGLSLGEYSALTASGVFTLEQVVPLVRKRGQYMQEAVPQGIGKMSAILGLSEDKVREACTEASALGIVEPANFNCPGQIVIGGEIQAVDEAARLTKEKGAMKAIDLSVSAPFHTSMLKPAADKLRNELEPMKLGTLAIPLVCNVNADIVSQSDEVKNLLYQQVMSSVLWEQSIRRMLQMGVRNFVEIGPGKTLSGFVRKIERGLGIYNVEDMASLEATVSALKSGI